MSENEQNLAFLVARKAVRDRFKALSKIINEARAAYKKSMREGTSHRFDFEKYPCFTDGRWQYETTLLCMTLAHSYGHLHADRLFSKQTGRGIVFSNLEDQADYLRKQLLNMTNKNYAVADQMRIVAFTVRPKSTAQNVVQPEFVFA